MKTAVIVHVHTGASHTFQSSDFRGYRHFTNEESAKSFVERINSETGMKERSCYVNKTIGITLIYLQDYEYNSCREIVEQYFRKGESYLAKKYWDDHESKENEKRQKQGFVYYKSYEEMKPSDYLGNLSKSLTEFVREYIGHGHPGGYLGHSCRKFSHDKIIEKIVSKISMSINGTEADVWELLGAWITSSDARHWMDSMEDKNLKEFQSAFGKYVERALKLGYIYMLPEHEGTMASTHELMANLNLKFGKA